MSAQVVYQLGGKQQSFALEGDEIRIGRAPDNDLVIQDASISRNHAKIYRENERWHVTDLGSKNGTQVNGLRNSKAALRHADEILLGSFPLSFSDEAARAAVALSSRGGAGVDEPGTIFRSAIDFSELAAQKSAGAEASDAKAVDVDRLAKLVAIVSEVSKSLLAKPVDDTLKLVMDLVFEHLPVERGCIMLWDESSDDLVARVVKSREGEDDGSLDITISRTIAEKVYREKVGVLTTDAQSDPRFAGGESILALGIRSAMCAPLWKGDDVDGIIYVDTPLHVQALGDFDLDLLSALGNHAALALEQARLQESILNEQISRTRLERYHSPAVVERITNSGTGDETLDAEERDVTLLFCDVVGFTNMCEHLDPRSVSNILNRYFSRMADMIFRHDGTLDKFIGDAIMAVFGAPLAMENHAERAVGAAVDMRLALDDLNAEVDEDERLRFRVGLHSGKVIAGDMGSVRRRDYSVLGATVNLAARLESSVAKPGQIVISDVTHDMVKDAFMTDFVGEHQPKGISRQVRCYAVVGRDPSADDDLHTRGL